MIIKKTVILLIAVLINVVAFAQSDSIKGNSFELEGQLINEVKLSPHCGIFAWAVVLEFKVSKYSDDSYKKENIAVIIPCPEFYGQQFFETGKKYKMVVADENQGDFRWTIFNSEKLKKYNLKKQIWIIEAKKVE